MKKSRAKTRLFSTFKGFEERIATCVANVPIRVRLPVPWYKHIIHINFNLFVNTF